MDWMRILMFGGIGIPLLAVNFKRSLLFKEKIKKHSLSFLRVIALVDSLLCVVGFAISMVSFVPFYRGRSDLDLITIIVALIGWTGTMSLSSLHRKGRS